MEEDWELASDRFDLDGLIDLVAMVVVVDDDDDEVLIRVVERRKDRKRPPEDGEARRGLVESDLLLKLVSSLTRATLSAGGKETYWKTK